MERYIQLDWPAIVEEAISRRKQSRLTQKQLAVLAGVSGPTVTRFERQEKNITLKSTFAILKIPVLDSVLYCRTLKIPILQARLKNLLAKRC